VTSATPQNSASGALSAVSTWVSILTGVITTAALVASTPPRRIELSVLLAFAALPWITYFLWRSWKYSSYLFAGLFSVVMIAAAVIVGWLHLTSTTSSARNLQRLARWRPRPADHAVQSAAPHHPVPLDDRPRHRLRARPARPRTRPPHPGNAHCVTNDYREWLNAVPTRPSSFATQ
jgi:uncharacterized membrane protein YciS (DUF1049 family)